MSCWTHLLGAAVALVASYWLFRPARGRPGAIAALSVYLFGVLFMFSMSGVYHLLEPGGAPRAVLRRLDHAGIWVQIAGTFTPIHALRARGFWRWGFLTLIWICAITGLTLRTVFFGSLPEGAALALYLGMGWLGVASAVHFGRRHGWDFVRPFMMGGVLYTVGAVLEFARWPTLIPGVIGPHELFHLFVIAGVFVHWRFIQQRVVQGPEPVRLRP
ncbi:MAG: PAQR family membrane homeostasis protein TrhA [Myxococcota bacterium]